MIVFVFMSQVIKWYDLAWEITRIKRHIKDFGIEKTILFGWNLSKCLY